MLIAIDPGFTTGTAIADHIESAERFNLIGAFEVKWSQRFDFFATFFDNNASRLEAVIIERYKLTSDEKLRRDQIGSEMPQCEVIGQIRTECYRHNIAHLVVKQDNWVYHSMHVLGVHRDIVGPSKHNQVAYRHMRYYIRMRHVGDLL